MFKKLVALFLCICFASACQKNESKVGAEPVPTAPSSLALPQERGLTQMAAVDRAKIVSDIAYGLNVSISADLPEFTGTVAISFDLAKTGEALTIDFTDGKIASLAVNGKDLEPKYNGLYLSIPAETLKTGRNEVRVAFTHPYSTNGSGLYRFLDPEDKKTYLYTDFEPYNANLFFPCFDQPDLKAKFTLAVEAPADWQIVAATRETGFTPVTKGRKTWMFPESLPMSTYVFSLFAGPYRVWEDKTADGIPLRLFARESLAKHVEYAEFFELTKRGMAFYQDYFAYPYPFAKYDQVLVPDFNTSAMENVAAVTLTENFVYRGKPDHDERQFRADTILHELSHMWFGNLVTMKWWNGLWLNESFASYMAALAMTQTTEFSGSWLNFNIDNKTPAYFEDRLSTTHPVETPVQNTAQAFAIFDSISYGKGASALKQLAFHLGADGFRDGVRAYLKKNAFSNAELKDFIGTLAATAGTDLNPWTGAWLRHAGVNAVTADYACEDGKIARFAIRQRADHDNPTLRFHATLIGLYGETGGTVTLAEAVPVQYYGAKTEVTALVGKPCPLWANLNQDDHDYAVQDLTERDVAALAERVSRIPSALSRRQIWQALWDAVRDGKIPVQRYADIVISNLPAETEFTVANSVIATLGGSDSGSVLRFLPDERNRTPSTRMAHILKCEDFLRERLHAAAAGSDFQKLWYDAYVRLARSPRGEAELAAFLSGDQTVPGLMIDQDLRWSLVVKLNSFAQSGRPELVEAELKRDPSASGRKMAIAAEAIRPDPAVKSAWFDRITAPQPRETLAELTSAMESLFPLSQTGLAETFVTRFFERLPELAKTKDDEFLESFTLEVLPDACGKTTLTPLHDFIQANPRLTAIVMKNLRNAREEQARCARVRAIARKFVKEGLVRHTGSSGHL